MWGTIKGRRTAKRQPLEGMYASSGEEEEGSAYEVDNREGVNAEDVQDFGNAELMGDNANIQDLAGATDGASI
ncbi:hypothetical protein TWF506_007714 [Arthrobotrys conoides]|uniref:Uncharacterized protein n=1 Tax=Arthrobotrys conoides TaxID=74498 RepID=A0AAN8NAX3_9PEZI